jgi:hypothetical protein
MGLLVKLSVRFTFLNLSLKFCATVNLKLILPAHMVEIRNFCDVNPVHVVLICVSAIRLLLDVLDLDL